MHTIILDLEMEPVPRKKTEIVKICNNEVIEFGAVMLDENLNEISQFREYVKPFYSNRIIKVITDLTGITTEMVSGADNFYNVLNRFVEYCHSCNDDFKVYSWSMSDIHQLQRECTLKNIKITEKLEYIFNNWVDLQKEFDNAVQSPDSIKLERALIMLGQPFEGKCHNALSDAINTAYIYREMQNKDKMMEAIKHIREYTDNDEPVTFTLGSLLAGIKFE